MSNVISRTLWEQMGAGHIHGAVCITGGRNVVIGEDGPLVTTKIDEQGFISIKNGLMYSPNVASRKVKIIVVLQPADTYSVIIWKGFSNPKALRTGKVGEEISRKDGVYCDQLVDIIDQMYLNFLTEFEEGCIPF